nr:T9SS type A sorting domain-containing protein [Subsaxibacter sp. CAU 1640]
MLSPNPSSDDVTVDMMGPAPCRLSQPITKWEGQITYTFYTNAGILVFKKEKANLQESFNIKNLKEGMYYIEAILPDGQRLSKPLLIN